MNSTVRSKKTGPSELGKMPLAAQKNTSPGAPFTTTMENSGPAIFSMKGNHLICHMILEVSRFGFSKPNQNAYETRRAIGQA